jgi:serine/threonine protein phosphatase 1
VSSHSFAIGDIHGCDVALEVLLNVLRPTSRDTVIVLGDVIDRGPNSARVLDLLCELQEYTQLVFILGNHEEMMLSWLDTGEDLLGWRQFGGEQTLNSYGKPFKPEMIPQTHINLLTSAVPYFEMEDDLFVHANLEPGVALSDQSDEWLRWTHLSLPLSPWDPDRRVICGHTPQLSGMPLVEPGWLCIDTNSYGGGWLTAVDVLTGETYQTRQNGSYRNGWLPGL